MKVAIINKERGREIFGKPFTDGMIFNPVLSANMDIIISEEEINQCDNPEFSWLKGLELKEKHEIDIE